LRHYNRGAFPLLIDFEAMAARPAGLHGLPSPPRMRALFGRSLLAKIMAASAVLVLPLTGAFWYRSLLIEKRYMTANAADFAGSFSQLVRRSVRDEMLGNNREHVQRTIASITGSESLRTVRIYDRFGTVAFSSSPADVGRRVGQTDRPCLGCHGDPLRPRETLHESKRYAVFSAPDGHRVLSYVEPIYNEPACSTGDCHAHEEGARVLGILIADFPLTRLDQRVERQVRDFSAFVVLYILTLGTMGYLVLWRIVLRPVSALTGGVELVAAGDLTKTVPVTSRDEIGRLAANFNAMTMELAASRRRMERLTQGLELQVAEKTAEVRKTEGRLAEAEKLAALGRLTAEIAHEIRNPLTALGGYGRRLLRTVSTEAERECARIVVREATRLEGLLKDVLDYARPARFDLQPQPLSAIVRESLAAFGERCVAHGIRVESDLAAEPLVLLDPGHARRAVDNIVANAIDAMRQGGTLRVSTGLAIARCLTYGAVAVEDTGPGIPAGDLARIYEPFWTTKKMGEGTGLGLSITRKIVEAHGGFIRVANRPEGGLVVSLWFHLRKDAAPAGPACWEALRCGRAGADVTDPCPAWPHFGRACWAVAGTLCEGKVRGTQANILGDCGDCGFFRETVLKEDT
jgi:signal transduction histidine kinase